MVGAALLNALKVVGKKIGDVRIVINGAGSAGIAIGKHLLNLGVKHLKMVDRFGVLCEGEQMNPAQEEMAKITNPEKFSGKLADAMKGADVFIGVSAPGSVTGDMVRSMAKACLLFPCSTVCASSKTRYSVRAVQTAANKVVRGALGADKKPQYSVHFVQK